MSILLIQVGKFIIHLTASKNLSLFHCQIHYLFLKLYLHIYAYNHILYDKIVPFVVPLSIDHV